jgi:hypothetical protein
MTKGTQTLKQGDRFVTLKFAGATCRLCGGHGADPYSHRQSCRSCGGRGWKANRHGVDAIYAIDAWRSNPPVAEGEDALAAFVAFAESIKGVKVTVSREGVSA